VTAGLDRSFYRGADGDLRQLAGLAVAVVGYGNLGRSVALNLRDSGLAVCVGSRQDDSADAARREGFRVMPIAEAVRTADVVWFLLPDEVLPAVLVSEAAEWKEGSLACFSSGYALAFGLADLSALPIDVVVVAPRMVGAEVRACYLDRTPFMAYAGVEQDRSGAAAQRTLALGRAFGGERLRILAMSARDEARLDLFVEQSLGPVLGMAVLAAFDVGVEAGLLPEALAAELYGSGEMARTWQAFADEGFFRAVGLHGHTARFGGFVRSGDVDTAGMRQRFARILAEIGDGTFARQFQEELAAGSPTLAAIEAFVDPDNPLSRAEDRLARAFGGEQEPVRLVPPFDGRAAAVAS
jgi:ketol-acid reductoisomerase